MEPEEPLGDPDHNPEIEAILHDIARDPRARMLRVPSSGEIVRMTRGEPIGASAPSLTSAERHLLHVHRGELDALLRQRALIQLYSGPDADTRWHKSVTVDQQLEIPDGNDWERRARAGLEVPIDDERSRMGADVLWRCITGSERVPSITQIAMAALRLRNSDQARAHVAMDLLNERRWSDAIETYEALLSDRPLPLTSSYCLEGIGVALFCAGEPIGAWRAFRAAAMIHTERPIPVINWLLVSLTLGNRSSSLEAAHILDAQVSPQDPCLVWSARVTPEPDRGGVPAPSPAAREMARRLKDEVGDSSRKVIDAVLA